MGLYKSVGWMLVSHKSCRKMHTVSKIKVLKVLRGEKGQQI